MAGKEEEDQRCDGKTESNEILKGQVRTAKSGRPLQKTGGDGVNNKSGRSYQVTSTRPRKGEQNKLFGT